MTIIQESNDSYLDSFHGPYVIVEGLTHPHKKQLEDNVLVVYGFSLGKSSMIALGLFSGRLILSELFFGDKSSSDMCTAHNNIFYKQIWKYQLPYPLHGIYVSDIDNDGYQELTVSTKWSFHVFRNMSMDDLVFRTEKKLKCFIQNYELIKKKSHPESVNSIDENEKQQSVDQIQKDIIIEANERSIIKETENKHS